MPGAIIRVLVGEDVRVVRETLVALLSLEEDIDVVAALASGDRIVPAALQHHPDVALLDIDLPGADGLAEAAELGRRLPGCRALILTGWGRRTTSGWRSRRECPASCSRTGRRMS